jgi:hypothetical protein
MQKLLDWTLDAIRMEDSSFSWIEEYRYDWVPLIERAIVKILNCQAVLILTDDKRAWFEDYIMINMNNPDFDRPFLPFYSLKKLFPHIPQVTSKEDLDFLDDMLTLTYPNGYFIWYIGKSDHFHTKFAFRCDGNLLWMIGDDVTNGFKIKDGIASLDIRLIQLFKIFNKTINAGLFNEVKLDVK